MSLLIQIASHEYAHARPGERCPLLGDSMVREGSTEWAACHTLLGMDEKVKGEPMLRRHDGYGVGLRPMLDIERQRGVTGVLDYGRAA